MRLDSEKWLAKEERERWYPWKLGKPIVRNLPTLYADMGGRLDSSGRDLQYRPTRALSLVSPSLEQVLSAGNSAP